MRVVVDKDRCEGCGLCEDTCPEMFLMEGKVAAVREQVVPPECEWLCEDAADDCPVKAITILRLSTVTSRREANDRRER